MKRTLVIDRDAQAPGKARDAVAGLVPHVDERLVPNAKLLLSELITNAVKYGAGPIELSFEVDPSYRLRCEVADEGAGFTPAARSGSRRNVGGWGLYLVEELAESWGVQDGSTHVWFQLALEDT